MTKKDYEDFYCAYCDSQRCGDFPPFTCFYRKERLKGGFEMREVSLQCPNCKKGITFKNIFHWILHSPFHMFTKRLTKCPFCGKKSWMKRCK